MEKGKKMKKKIEKNIKSDFLYKIYVYKYKLIYIYDKLIIQ